MKEQFETTKEKAHYEKLGITAIAVAYYRTSSDIKYSKEIFNLLDLKGMSPKEKVYLEDVKETKLGPQMEARYKLVNSLLKQTGIKQVLEIASGLSPRGLELTDNNDFKYVEVDLPEVIAEKQKIVESIGSRPNLHLQAGNALELDSLMSATESFQQGPIVVINEGLLRYLNFDQKRKVAENIHAILEKFGGYWFTPDITIQRIIGSVGTQHRTRILELTGINIAGNAFTDNDQAKKFFEDIGFKVEVHPFGEVKDQLVSPKNLNLNDEKVDSMLEAAVFKMTT